jgi:hypothetical protein
LRSASAGEEPEGTGLRSRTETRTRASVHFYMRSTWLAFALVACTRAPPIAAERGTPSSIPSYDAGPAPAALAPPPDAAPEPTPGPGLVAWTDPDVVAELVKSCRFSPPKASDDSNASPLACEAAEFEQSCLYDPCFNDKQDKCKPKCRRGCDACAAKCTTACEACKAPCKDDDCKKTCATTCGACRQACVTDKDKCLSGTCFDSYMACRKSWRARYEASKCPAACAKFKECSEPCYQGGGGMGACLEKCRAKVAAACPGDLMTLCEAGGD